MYLYKEFLDNKRIQSHSTGFDPQELDSRLYDFQRDLVRWVCRKGKAALFTMTGTGKTAMQLAWADQVCSKTGKGVLLLSPLAVAQQTVREAEKFGIEVHYCRSGTEMKKNKINITNYEMLHAFSSDGLAGIILDESGILKSFDSRTRNDLITFSKDISYKLACTATPAPNDYMELGNHAEFLGIMTYMEMLATFFTQDRGDTSKWRLKGYAEQRFWEWLASWSVFMVKPSDLGYSDEGFDLPELRTFEHIIKSSVPAGQFFVEEAGSLQDRLKAQRASLKERVYTVAEIVHKVDKPCLIWCNLNVEGVALRKAIPDCLEIKGSDTRDWKEQTMLDFADGKVRVLITKPDIAGFGMNWQVCHEMIFAGITDSFEKLFQATKRFHRHGQLFPVNRHIVVSEAEGSVLKNIQRKEADFMRMIGEMVRYTSDTVKKNIGKLERQRDDYVVDMRMRIPEWLSR